MGHGYQRQFAFNSRFPLALTALPFNIPDAACRALSPNKMPLHTSSCLQHPGNTSTTFHLGCTVPGSCRSPGRAKSSPASSGPALSRTATAMHLPHRSPCWAAPAPLPHEPPTLPLLLPAWAPPPLPPLQQISLKCAAIWFQLSPIFFLVD